MLFLKNCNPRQAFKIMGHHGYVPLLKGKVKDVI